MDGCAGFGEIDAFDFQHDFGDFAQAGVCHFRRENLSEAAFHLVHAGNSGFAEVEKFSVAAADDGQEFLFLAAVRFAHEDDDFLTVKRLGRRFGHVHLSARRGGLHPGFKRHNGNRGSMRILKCPAGLKLTRCCKTSNFFVIKSKQSANKKLKNDRRKPVRIAYRTARGVFFQGQAEDVLTSPLTAKYRGKVDLIFTSPPFPLNRKKKYGNLQGEEYVNWLKGLALTFRGLLKQKGSIVMEVGNSWEEGKPVMSTLALKALLAFLETGKFYLCQQFIWNNPARLPSPAQWVNVERIRVKDSYTHLWWMSPTERPKADNRRVLNGYSDSMKKLLATKKYNAGKRPSEHHIGKKSFLTNNHGAIPSNVITLANTQASSDYLNYCRKKDFEPHPARMPIGLPEFFIKFLTDRGGLVLDPFGGSNTAGAAAENLHRKWLAIEPQKDYIRASKGRFKKTFSRRKKSQRTKRQRKF